jgi:hypothetical protein
MPYTIGDAKKNVGQSNLSQTQPTTQQAQKKGLVQKLSGGVKTLENVGIGATKGAVSTLTGMSSLMEKGVRAILPSGVEKALGLPQGTTVAQQTVPQSWRTPTNTAQKVGFAGEQLGEFLIPVGGEAKVASLFPKAAKATTLLGKVIQAATRGVEGAAKMGVVGGEFAGKTAIQTGGDFGQAKTSGIIGAASVPVFGAVGKIAPIVSDLGTSAIAMMIKKRPADVAMALSKPALVAKAMIKKVIPLNIRNEAVTTLKQYKQAFGDTFEKGLQALQEKTGGILPYTQQPVKNAVKGIVGDITKGLPDIFRKAGIAVEEGGAKLNFYKLNSAITKSGEMKNLQEAYNTIKRQFDFTPAGMQRTAARLNNLIDVIEGNEKFSSVVATKIHDLYSKAIEATYPELGALRGEYRMAKEIHEGLSKVLNSVKNEVADPIAVTSATKRLSNVAIEDNDAYIKAIKALEDISGKDFLGQLAATEFANWFPGSIGSVLFQAGAIAGGAMYFHNPLILATLPMFSPRFMGKVVTGYGRIASKAKEIEYVLPRVAARLKQGF